MASGSKNFSVTRTEIIAEAYERIGVYDIGETISGEDTNSAKRSLDLMVKFWVARGADIHLRQNLVLFLQPQQQSYEFSSSSSDEYTNGTITETTLSAAEASGQTVISVTSNSGVSVGDRCGIKLDDDTIHWAAVTVVGSGTVTIGTATDGAASSGNRVFFYTTKGDIPRRIVYAFRTDKNGFDTEVDLIGENEYHRLADKDSNGPPTQVYYRYGTGSGTLFVWPTDWGANGEKLELVTRVLPDDFDSGSDEPDFPIEWGQALVSGLAARLAPKNGIPARDRRELREEAEFELQQMLDFNVEDASVIFEMDL